VKNYGSGRSQNNIIAGIRQRIALGKTIAEGNAKLMNWLRHGKTQNSVVARKKENTTGINPKLASLLGRFHPFTSHEGP